MEKWFCRLWFFFFKDPETTNQPTVQLPFCFRKDRYLRSEGFLCFCKLTLCNFLIYIWLAPASLTTRVYTSTFERNTKACRSEFCPTLPSCLLIQSRYTMLLSKNKYSYPILFWGNWFKPGGKNYSKLLLCRETSDNVTVLCAFIYVNSV